jgi:hypothetical protein
MRLGKVGKNGVGLEFCNQFKPKHNLCKNSFSPSHFSIYTGLIDMKNKILVVAVLTTIVTSAMILMILTRKMQSVVGRNRR